MLAVPLVLVAGCTGSTDAPPLVADQGVEVAPPRDLPERESNWTITAGTSGQVIGLESTGPNGFRLEVPEDSERIRAHAQWTCASGSVCRMALAAAYGDERLEYTSGLSPLNLTVDGPEAGWWTVWVGPAPDGSVVVQAEGRLHAAVE